MKAKRRKTVGLDRIQLGVKLLACLTAVWAGNGDAYWDNSMGEWEDRKSGPTYFKWRPGKPPHGWQR